MFQQDYLMRLIGQFVRGIRRSMERGEVDPAEAALSVEDTIAQTLDLDAGVVLGLHPESFASILSVSGTEPRVAEYLVRALTLEASYLGEAGSGLVARLRRDQARALAAAYGIEAPADGEIPLDGDAWDAMLREDGIEQQD